MLLRHDSKLKRMTSALTRAESPRKKIQIQTVVCGMYFTVFTTEEGEVWAFGENRHGELGQGAERSRDRNFLHR